MAGQKIRIEDLADPVLDEGQKAALAYADTLEIDLSVEAVQTAAREATGLDEWGDDDWKERLGVWFDEMNADENRTNLGRLTFFNDTLRYATTRLRINALLAEHPEIHDQKIQRPIIVVGLPRSGTTHLVNLIAADQRLRSMPLWEGQEPVPDPKENPGADGVDPRWTRCNAIWERMRTASPLIASMHPMEPDHIHEELEFLLPDFTSYNIEWVARTPIWRDYHLAHDQTPHYQGALLTGLKILQWIKPRDRWILKCPQHLEQLGPLMKTFPDATIVMTHRDPVSVIQSAITMMTYSSRVNYKHTDPRWYLEYWHDRVHRLLSASMRDRDLIRSDRVIDVPFHEFMADDVRMVEKIYEIAGLTMTNEARTQIGAYMDAHPRGKAGQVVYDLRKDFDADPTELRRSFDSYFDRFAVRAEAK
ncbi:MAG: sulfotransferase [bacterium]|nr:sulfotransferase family protein [Deltaproteobacteria bacterium]MCP4904243.1 sulfotransferase [bacterium]